MANAVNRYLLTPDRNTTGKNTIAVMKVAASTAKATSRPPFFCSGVRIFSHFKVAKDVLQHYHGVVDQSREYKRKPAKHDGVNGAAHGVQKQESCQAGDRNG